MQQELKNNLKLAHDKISALKDINLQTIDRILSIKDSYTLRHQKETATLAAEIASKMGLDEKYIQNIYLAATVHDIGKIAIPYEILNKPGRLLKEEYDLVKRHSIIGYDIIKHFAFDEEVKRFVLEHHERLDGSGYPDQKQEQDLLLGSKILAVADTVEAMMSDRPYRKALSTEFIIDELKKECGIKLDATTCKIAISILTGE
ncbi:MAG: HD domain-containing protein [Bacilli bacterium]|nr:HD domain-containing protein [Bacilli bacterium]